MKTSILFLFILAFSVACKRDRQLDIHPTDLESVFSHAPDSIPGPDEELVLIGMPQEAHSDSAFTDDIAIRFLALGDSYTIGQSVDSALRWPSQLAARLSQEDGLVVSELRYIAQTGWTTGALSNAMDYQEIDTAEYDLVSLLIGVNNQFIGASVEDYADEFVILLERAVNIAGGNTDHVFVLSIPDYGYTPFGDNNGQASISESLQVFNDTCMDLTLAAGVAWYNITPISQQYPEVQGLVASDGLHPSGFQYTLWVDAFYEEVLSKLEE